MIESVQLYGRIVVVGEDRFRILNGSQELVPLCRLDTNSLEIRYINRIELLRQIRNKEVLIEDEKPEVFDYEQLPKWLQEQLDEKRKIMREIVEHYGPLFRELLGKASKVFLKEKAKEAKMSNPTIWKYVRQYLQSGYADIALIDKRFAGVSSKPRPNYQYTVKTGRPNNSAIEVGVVRTKEVEKQFEEFFLEYKKGRETTYENAYAGLIQKYYFYYPSNGDPPFQRPISECPTFEQFYRYCHQRLSKDEKDAIKTSRAEQRNNKRLLTGSPRVDAVRPGWIVEVDAWEADVSVVAENNLEQCVGRPIVYFMVDVFSRAIVAMSVSFENNSYIGLTNLLLNLGDDKVQFAAKYGLPLDVKYWPSNFIPHEIRCDRGAEMKGKLFGTVCNRLGITHTLVPPAMGSYKGLVEQSFHQLNSAIKPLMEGKGLITKRHDSNHHREAMLTLEDFTRQVITFLVSHNRSHLDASIMSKDMHRTEGFVPSPIGLWEYGCERFGMPRMITDATKEQFLFDLLIEEKAKLDRTGINFKNLRYINSTDTELLKQMYDAGRKKVDFMVRIDPRDVNQVYYMRDNKLHAAPLNLGCQKSMSYAGMTWAEYEGYRARSKSLAIDSKEHNRRLAVERKCVNEVIVSAATTDHLADTNGILVARGKERHATNKSNCIKERIVSQTEGLVEHAVVESSDCVLEERAEADDPFATTYDLREANRRFHKQRGI